MSGKIFGKNGTLSFLCNLTSAICVFASEIGSSERKRGNVHTVKGTETVQDKGDAKDQNQD